MTQVARRQVVDLSLLGVAIAWGSSYLAAKSVATPESVFGFLTVRFALAAFGLALLLLARLRHTTLRELRLGTAYGAVLGLILTLETFGVTQTSASNAGLIISLTMVMTPFLEQRVRGRELPFPFYLATAVAVIGVAVLTQSAGFAWPGSGDILILCAAVARAVHVTIIASTSEGRKLDSARMTAVQMFTCLGIFAAVSTVVGESALATARGFSATDWMLTLYLAVACTIFAFFIQMWAVRRTSPSRVSLLLGTEPLWAAIIGIWLGGDLLSWTTVIGGALVLLGTNWGRTIEARGENVDPKLMELESTPHS